jgi:hypothetical protein
VFIWLFLLDSVLWVTAILIVQWVTVGFDPIFANPILIAFGALLTMILGIYLPFFILYKFVFEVIVKRIPKVRPSMLCWMLLVGLLLICVGLNVLSFGRTLDLIGVLFPAGLCIINVAFFFQRRIRATRSPATPR